MSGLKVAMFLGSVREGRMADRVAKVVQQSLEKREMFVQIFGKYTDIKAVKVLCRLLRLSHT